MWSEGFQPMTSQGFADERARYLAFKARDARADGQFIVAVKTTGIYCRPVCPARPPKRENIEFFDDVVSARRAGYRACLRCKPDDVKVRAKLAEMITQACRALEADEDTPAVGALARKAGVSTGQFHRLFKQATGLSPKQYALARRVDGFRARLTQGAGVTEALYDSGFNSSSRAYEAGKRLGVTPRDVKSGGEKLTLQLGVARCSLGHVGIGVTPRGLAALAFGDTADAAREAVQARFPKALLVPSPGELKGMMAKVVALVDNPGVLPGLPLDIRGTAFQERVWQALRRIPVGETQSYAAIARAIGRPSSHRAVANACGANRIAVAIPCHRVVASDGGVGGYAWGVARKKALLAKEARKASR